MSDFDVYASNLSLRHLGSGFNDIVAFIFDAPREFNLNAQYSNITPDKILEVKQFGFNFNQKSYNQNRFVGEGADPSVLSIGQISISANLKTVLFENDMGWVTPVFANIWYKTGSSWWGTSTAAAGNLVENASVGDTTLVTDNVSDFSNLATPFALSIITEVGTPENVSVTSVNKANRTLTLSAGTTYAHNTGEATLVCLQNNNSFKPDTEPAFSLLSLREGLLAPCLINKISLNASVGQDVSVDLEIKSLGVYRDKQIDLNTNRQLLIDGYSSVNNPMRVVNGTNVKIQLSAYNSGTFGLPTALGDNLFTGYQGLTIPDFVVTGISLTIDNQLKEIYSAHSLKSDVQSRRRENAYPYALYSEGRLITGKISYRSPIDFFSNLEKLAGPSSINGGGLIIDFGNFKITLNELAWEPSSGDGNMESQTRTINFTALSETRNSMPSLEFTEQV